ncbi:hypothetical protein S40288_01025, partial [Stachybotrys chartarum IBT 40288]
MRCFSFVDLACCNQAMILSVAVQNADQYATARPMAIRACRAKFATRYDAFVQDDDVAALCPTPNHNIIQTSVSLGESSSPRDNEFGNEYPLEAPEIPGIPAGDIEAGQNYRGLLKDMKDLVGGTYSFSFSAPASYGFTSSSIVSNAYPDHWTGTGGYNFNTEIREIVVSGNYSGNWTAARSDILFFNNTECVAYMNDSIKSDREELCVSYNEAGTSDWAVDLLEFLDGSDGGVAGEFPVDYKYAIDTTTIATSLIQPFRIQSMADPLSVTASVLAIVTAAIQSTNSLKETVSRYRERDKTLHRLQDELEDLIKILKTLETIQVLEHSMLSLLQGPISRCTQVCYDFESSMKRFHGKTKVGFRDWTKLEFMKGNINDFMEALIGYKSTIAIGLGIITLQASKISQQVLEEYSEMIKDTTYNLQLHLQRIDDKMALLGGEMANTSDTGTDLKDERAVTAQCLRICEDAKSYLESLIAREPSLQQNPPRKPPQDARLVFEAQQMTRKAMESYRDNLVETIGRLRERLENLAPSADTERSRLQNDIEISKQCLEVCKIASHEVANQKIHTIGEAIAEEDSDQMVVTTLADLFDVRKASSRGRSAQLVGSMTDETLRQISEDRYGSRFGALSERRPWEKINSFLPHQQGKNVRAPGVEEKNSKAFANE